MMIDEYAKTLVIDDPNYDPAQLIPNAPTSNASVPRDPDADAPGDPLIDAEAVQDDLLPENDPAFDDTSWLT